MRVASPYSGGGLAGAFVERPGFLEPSAHPSITRRRFDAAAMLPFRS